MTPLLFALAAFCLSGGAVELDTYQAGATADVRRLLLDRPPEKKSAKVGFSVYDPFTALAGRLRSASVEAERFRCESLPFTLATGSRRGRIGKLKIRLHDFTLGHLDVDTLQADVPGCRYDLAWWIRHRKIRLTESGEGPAQVSITEEGLSKFIRYRIPALKSLHVRLGADRILIDGSGLLLKGEFFVTGRLRPNGRKVLMTNFDMTLNGVEASPPAIKALTSILNPVLDLDRDLGLRGSTTMTSIHTWGGRMIVDGHVHIPS